MARRIKLKIPAGISGTMGMPDFVERYSPGFGCQPSGDLARHRLQVVNESRMFHLTGAERLLLTIGFQAIAAGAFKIFSLLFFGSVLDFSAIPPDERRVSPRP
jgi:hypothetical protein